MKVLQINTVYSTGSTGRIVCQLQDTCKQQGVECIAAARGVKNSTDITGDFIQISSHIGSRIHGALSAYTMLKGCFSYFETFLFIRKVKKYKPDIIHLHNLHGSYVNIGLLMKYIKKHSVKVVFTLHDCWAMTAICSHFMISGCDKWKTGCGDCPQLKKYSLSPFDVTDKVWKLKKKWFSDIKDLTVVTPSVWLADLVKQSFLKDYTIKVINNGIDLDVFAPTSSDFREKYNLINNKLILGVAFDWGYGKGLDVIVELAQRLTDDFRIILVGADEKTDIGFSQRIIPIRKTNHPKELAEIYSAADVFINPTREEVLGLVNIEALACGTPVITFNAGGSPECINENCGTVVDVDDVDAMEREIKRICVEHPYRTEDCIECASHFNKNDRFKEYVELYKSIVE